MSSHPVRDDIDLLDGSWYTSEPHHLYEWMRHNAPAYHDTKNDVWGITRYEDVLAIEKDAVTFSSRRSPRPHGDPLPMMISMDNPQHQRRRSLVSRGFTPRRVVAPKEERTAVAVRSRISCSSLLLPRTTVAERPI